MLVTIKGKQLDVGDALRAHVETALTGAVGKYFGNALESHVVMTREAHLFRADVSVHVGRDILVQGQGSAVEPYVAADQAIERVAKRLRRYKRRLRDHHARERIEIMPAQSYVLAPEPEDAEESGSTSDQPMIIAEMVTEIPTLSVGEAVMRLDLGDHSAIMFRSAVHGGLNLVHRRPDGNIGWIDPQGNAQLGTENGSGRGK
jgi:ribosomal subunit interface protein